MGRELLKKDLIIRYIIAVIACIFFTGFYSKISNNRLEKMAISYFYKEQYDQAIEVYKKLANTERSNALWDAKISELYYLTKDSDNCEKYLNSAKNKDNNEQASNTILFVSLMNYNYNNLIGRNKNIKDVIELGEKYLKDYPNKKDLIKTMIQVYLTNNEIEKAKNLVEKYPVDLDSAGDIATQGSMFLSLSEFDKAFEKLKQAYMVNKDEFKIYDVLAQGHQYEKEAFSNKIIKLYEENKDDEMLKLFASKIFSLDSDTTNRALEILSDFQNKNNKELLESSLIKVFAFQNSGNSSASEALINELLKISESDYRVLHVAAWYYYKAGQYDKAYELAMESIKNNKDYTDNYGFLLPEILKVTKEGVGAEPYIYYGIKLEPFNYTLHLNEGYYYWHVKKDSIRAVEVLNNARLFRTDNSESYYEISLIYLENNNYDKAIQFLQKSVERNNKMAKYHRTLGTAYLLMNDNSNAIKEIKTAYALDNSDVLTLNNAGCYYLTAEGDLEKALKNLEGAFKGLNKENDEYTRKTIKENYDKLLNIKEKYNNGKDNEVIAIPDLTMFY